MTKKKKPANEQIADTIKIDGTSDKTETVPEACADAPLDAGFPIVGIGASAGGLAAFESFFSGMPSDRETGMAFVLVQHLAPDHKSILTDLVKRYTRMQVFEVEDGMKVKPDCVYIIPPNRDMAFLNGTLQLLEPSAPRGQRLPIDFFFRSLAQDQHERAICIVLSGTGSDGTLGVRAVKGEGGMVMAQNPESTEYEGMPRSAISTGLVDFVLPPAEMPGQLITYAEHAYAKIAQPPAQMLPKTGDMIKKIFVLLRAQTGHDLSQYKQNTILRRIERRMAVHQIDNLEGYVRYLQKNAIEVESLFRNLLIGVTSFFRDPEAFEALQEKAIPRLFEGKPSGSIVRIWVPGCSTGEEAYSIAILIQESMQALKQNFKIQIFATDIDAQAIEYARTGVYPASITSDITPERLGHFFSLEPDGNTYRIQKVVRDMLIFSEHDIIKDPPFSKVDLISCRNLLIYMNGDLQKKIIPLFHYALNTGGMLYLGTSETVGEFVDLFSTLDRKTKLYLRRGDMYVINPPILGTLIPKITEGRINSRSSHLTNDANRRNVRTLTEQSLLDQYAPVGVLINMLGEILYLHGRTGQYLEPSQGEAVLNILKMAREGLKRELNIALHNAVTYKEPVHRPGLKVKTNGDYTIVNLTILPVPQSDTETRLFLVIFEDAPTVDRALSASDAAPHDEKKNNTMDTDQDPRIAALKQELRAKEEYLQAANEELETSNEELKSSNEELQSVNEELQSTNEELETSKEELQSVNEELATVNTELQNKVADLSRTNNDMNNLLAGTGVGTIFVDHQLIVQRFTPAVTRLINLISTDVGRPVGHIVSNLVGYDSLVDDIQSVLNTLIPREVEVQAKMGGWYLLRILPYRTLENVIEGAVITFIEITVMKKTMAALKEAEVLHRLAVVVRDSNDAIIVQDMDGRIAAWNPGAEKMYGWSEAEALTMNIRMLTPENIREDALATIHRLSLSEVLEPYNTQRITKDSRICEVRLTASALINDTGEIYAISTTERKR